MDSEKAVLIIPMERRLHAAFKKKCTDIGTIMTRKGRELIQAFLEDDD